MKPPRNIPVRSRSGRRRHALPETGGELTMCRRPVAGLLIDDALPDCKPCLRAIARALEARR